MDVSDLKRRVSRHFFDLVDEEANPLVVALALQDNSSVGLQHYAHEFHELHEELRQALRSRVEESYQGFNESVGVYRQVVSALKYSHEAVQGSKTDLEKLHEVFGNHKPVLKELHEKSIRYKRKLEILADLETLHQLPPTFEANVARKNFSEARLQLSHALETINSRNLIGQPAIKSLLNYTQLQQTELVAKLVDEMHATIYLESPYSQKRLEPENTDFKDFIKGLPVLPEPSPVNPEANSFSYLVLLAQNLADLQSLGTSLDGILYKVPQELNKLVVETSIQVVRDLRLSTDSIQRITDGQTLLEQFKSIDQSALETLARSLYAKLAKFLEAQRALAEIAAHYGLAYDFDSVCRSVIDTVKSFLLSYIGGEASTHQASKYSKMRPRASSDGEKSRVSRSRHGGSVFEFGPGDEDPKGLHDFEALRESLKESIPGLLADDPHHLFAETQQRERLEVVAPPHILNIRPLLEPSATFFAEARGIARSEKSQQRFDSFLDTFLRESFVPRLQEAFSDAIDAIAEDETAFDEMRNWNALSQLPIVNCAGRFAETVGLLSQLLDTGHSYREDYATMLVGLLSRIANFFTTQLANVFKLSSFSAATAAGSSNGSSTRRMFKVWDFIANNPEFRKVLESKYRSSKDISSGDSEFQVYFEKRQTPRTTKPLVSLPDLLDVRIFQKATLLITSVRWIVLRLRKMRQVASVDAAKNSENMTLRVRRRWTLLDATLTSTDSKSSSGPNAYLGTTEFNAIMNMKAMLAGQSLSEFDGVVSYLEEHAFKALCSLRADTFLRVVYYFDQMITNRDFHSSNRGEERDPVVDRLQQELSLVSQVFGRNLLSTDHRFLLMGIARFMNELFILEGENINDMNEAGQNQILTNIFALQQMLTSIVSDPRDVDFSRATGFYELFRLNPTLIIEKARDGETDLLPDDLKLLLQIRHRNASGTSTSYAFGTLSTHLSQINEIFKGASNGTPSLSGSKSTSRNTDKATSAGSKSAATSAAAPAPAAVSPIAVNRQAKEKQMPLNKESPSKASSARSASSVPSPQKSVQQPAAKPAGTDERPKVSQAKLNAEAAARKLREERAKELAEKTQREHDAQNALQAQKLRQEREALKSRYQEAQVSAQPGTGPVVSPDPSASQEPRSEKHVVTSAAPSATAAKSPLLNHRPRFESQQPPQQSANEPAASNPKVTPQYSQQRTAVQPKQEEVQPRKPSPERTQPPRLRPKLSAQSLSKVDTSLPPRKGSQPSPQTPDQPTSKDRPRTPSERALEAAQRVRVRQLPQNSRRPS